MKMHITNIYGQSPRSTAMISQNMVASVARGLGFKEIGIYSYPIKTDTYQEMSKRIDGMIASVSFGDFVVIQLPSWNGTEFDELLIKKLKSYRRIRIVVFVHDFIPLMFQNNAYLMDKHIELFNLSDAIILPSQAMADKLTSHGLKTRIIIQGMWDHPHNIDIIPKKFAKKFFFAGSPTRFPFVKNWNFSNRLEVFSDQPADFESKNNLNVMFTGWKNDFSLLDALIGGFGLVWSENISNQAEKEYSHLNISYKLSTYISAGIPVIANRGISLQKIIEDNKIGFVVSSLSEANEIVNNFSAEKYSEIIKNVENFAPLLRTGYFTKKALIDSMGAAFMKKEAHYDYL
ncbi:sugar transferase [Oenococcus oeni]|uniref:sugar transferase n=2 Tax=Oenococcus oeni TaxID=1247 RepID=UPI0008F8195C|nr:sugar transferase [Oenococcus oeni]OIK85157.1 nucleotide sugar synthetase [Oenococcus oeni]OIL08424.1 nucleotide sugar synthetase [Oenococcus oeni]OIL11263.1 nucleotide sugar synthetase [Oenococcus oeni]